MTMRLPKPNPITAKRLRRFWQLRRARWALLAMVVLYALTLAAELVCNSRPLAMRFEGRLLFPFCRFYPEDTFLHNGRHTRPDYLTLEREGIFRDSMVIWAPFKNDPYRIVPIDELKGQLRETVRLTPMPRVCGILLDNTLTISRASDQMGSLWLNPEEAPECNGHQLADFWELPAGLADKLHDHFAGNDSDALSVELHPIDGTPMPDVQLVVAPMRNGRPRALLRARLLIPNNSLASGQPAAKPRLWSFKADDKMPARNAAIYGKLPAELRKEIDTLREKARDGGQPDTRQLWMDGSNCTLSVEQEQARYPFRPIKGHCLGLDSAGRDVLARILYGLRLALNFGLILVVLSLAGGTLAGVLQGYLGGATDIIGQRLTEIWSALPFLYVMILMGSLYGTGFCLLIVCYALFNWISISYYMRAETLRLRKQPYVEAARCLGLNGWSIAFRHIIPNGLVPLITFFPFSLVGAIGSLAALDYLGFGVPPPAPSLGEMLSQAQPQPSAWWLILFPSLALFGVMLAGVFIGEGIRNAFDPKRQARLQ